MRSDARLPHRSHARAEPGSAGRRDAKRSIAPIVSPLARSPQPPIAALAIESWGVAESAARASAARAIVPTSAESPCAWYQTASVHRVVMVAMRW